MVLPPVTRALADQAAVDEQVVDAVRARRAAGVDPLGGHGVELDRGGARCGRPGVRRRAAPRPWCSCGSSVWARAQAGSRCGSRPSLGLLGLQAAAQQVGGHGGGDQVGGHRSVSSRGGLVWAAGSEWVAGSSGGEVAQPRSTPSSASSARDQLCSGPGSRWSKAPDSSRVTKPWITLPSSRVACVASLAGECVAAQHGQHQLGVPGSRARRGLVGLQGEPGGGVPARVLARVVAVGVAECGQRVPPGLARRGRGCRGRRSRRARGRRRAAAGRGSRRRGSRGWRPGRRSAGRPPRW